MKPTIQQQQIPSQITTNHEPMSRPQYGSASPKPKLGGGVGGTSTGAIKPSLNAPAPSQSFRRPSITSMTSIVRTNDFITGTNANHSATAIQRLRAPHLVQERIDHFTSINNVTNLSKSPPSVLLSSAHKQKQQQQQQQQLSTIRNSSISGDHVLSPILAQDITDHQQQGGQGLHTHFMDEGETGFDDVDHPHDRGDRDGRDGDRGDSDKRDGNRGGDLDDVRNSKEEEANNVNTIATATTTATAHTTITATPSRIVDMQRPRPPPMTSMSFMTSAQPQSQQQYQQRREEKTSATTRRAEGTPGADGGAMTAHRQHYHYTPAPSSSSSSSKLPAHNNTQNSSLLWQQQQQQQQQQQPSLPSGDLTMYELEASHMVNDRLEVQLEDLRADHAREMEKVLTKLAGLQSENDELGVENAALAAALLHDDSVALLRRVSKGQGQGGDHQRGGHESHSNVLGHQYQQRQQRDRKVSAATAALLELQELVLAAADRAQPQVQLEQEIARERASSAREIEHLKATIERMQMTSQQRVEEGDAVVQGLERTLQEMFEQVEAKELGLRKAAKDVASLRADCQRLSLSSEQWQGRYEDFITPLLPPSTCPSTHEH